MNIRLLAVFSGIIIVIVGLSFYVWNLYETNKEAEIMSDMDYRLASYDVAKGIAKDVSGLIHIRSDVEYEEGKQKFRKIMTDSIYNEYFPTDEYQGGVKYFTISGVSVAGEILDDTEFVFKLDMHLVEGELSTPITLLVYIKDERIYRIQSLG